VALACQAGSNEGDEPWAPVATQLPLGPLIDCGGRPSDDFFQSCTVSEANLSIASDLAGVTRCSEAPRSHIFIACTEVALCILVVPLSREFLPRYR
jgi:hypothetical protein